MLISNKINTDTVFMYLSSIFVVCLIITNIIGGKFFSLFGAQISCSILTYPITFVVTDIVSEIYGEYRASLLVRNGFIISICITLLIWLSNILPVSQFSPIGQKSFSQVFGVMPGMVFGSMIAYLCSQFIDIKLFEFFRKIAPKQLWVRNNFSTMTSQLADTIIVTTISLYLWPKIDPYCNISSIDFKTLTDAIKSQYIAKFFFALLDTPVVYLCVSVLRKSLFK